MSRKELREMQELERRDNLMDWSLFGLSCVMLSFALVGLVTKESIVGGIFPCILAVVFGAVTSTDKKGNPVHHDKVMRIASWAIFIISLILQTVGFIVITAIKTTAHSVCVIGEETISFVYKRTKAFSIREERRSLIRAASNE